MEKYKHKIQGVRCVVSSATQDSKQTVDDTLDESYDECIGVAVHKISDGGVTNGDIEVAVRNANETIVNDVSVHNLGTQQNDGSVPKDRFMPIGPFTTPGGNKIYVDFTPRGGDAATDIIYYFEFLLRRKITVQ